MIDATEIREIVHEGVGDVIEWALLEDGTLYAGTPTRFRVHLTHKASGVRVTIDTDDAGTTLGPGGEFEWVSGSSVVRIRLRALIASVPIRRGEHWADLEWFDDTTHLNGVRWGDRETQRMTVVVAR